jgi:hypothetical protein
MIQLFTLYLFLNYLLGFVTNDRYVDLYIFHIFLNDCESDLRFWDGTNRKLYVDGVEVAKDTDTQANLASSDGGLYIGAGKALEAGSFWSGLIDDVRIYDRAVTPSK